MLKQHNSIYDVLYSNDASALARQVEQHPHLVPVGAAFVDPDGLLYQTMQAEADIIQIIPAHIGTMARYKNKDGEVFTSPILAWGLTRVGEVVGLDADDNGWIETSNDVDNFIGYTIPTAAGVAS